MVTKMKNNLSSTDGGIWSPYLPSAESMFHQFCRKADIAIVNLAIEFNADVTRPNGDNLSPLDIAAGGGKDKVCEALIKAAKEYLGSSDLRNYLGKALVAACKASKGTLPTVKLLVTQGVDVNFDGSLNTCVKATHIDAFKFLIESGADVKGLSADSIMLLVVGGHQVLLELIIEKLSTSDQIDRMRCEWKIFEAAGKAMEIEKHEMKEFLCSKFGIDPQIIGSPNPLPGAVDARPGSGLTGSDVESPRIRRARINSIPEIEVSDTSSPRNKNVLMRMLSQLTPRSGSRISVESMQSSTESLGKKIKKSVSSFFSAKKKL